MEEPHERLAVARKTAGYKNAREACEAFGWTYSTYRAHENGQNGLRYEIANQYAKAFNTTALWLLEGRGKAPETGVPRPKIVQPPEQTGTLIPEIDVRAGAGGGGQPVPYYLHDGEGGTTEEELFVAHWSIPQEYLRNEIKVQPNGLSIVEIRGDSMEPKLYPGDRVVVDTSHKAPSPPGVYALFDGFGVVVKRIEFIEGSEPPTIRIISDNKNHEPYKRTLDEATIIGRIVMKIQAM